MRLFTASFFTTPTADESVLRVSIARSPPRNHPRGFKTLKALAPGPWFNSVSEPEYRVRYRAQLDALDVGAVLQQLAEMGSGRAAVHLLCWERPPFTSQNWCHRRLLAEYLQETRGLVVPEYDPAVL